MHAFANKLSLPCRRHGLVAFWLLVVCGFVVCRPAGAQAPNSSAATLPANVVGMLQASNIPVEAVGAIVLRLADGASVFAHNADTSMAPASTLKVLTSIVGLEKLGPTYRGRTEFRTDAAISDGVLKGDLILRGQADPDFDWQALQKMVQTMRHAGIREIRGNLVIDRQWFQPARTDIGVPPFDESPEAQYNVIPDALSLNTNLVNVDMASDAASMRVNFTPKLDRVSIVSFMKLVDRKCADWEDGWKTPVYSLDEDGSIRIELIGEYPKNCNRVEAINVLDRTHFADRLFRKLWQDAGGIFRGDTVEQSSMSAPGGASLAAHESRTLSEFVRDINKHSDNPMTRLLFLTLGAHGKNADAAGTKENTSENTSARAEAEVRAWLKSNGIDDAGLIVENGSGLSRRERIRPTQLAQVLRVASKSKWAAELMASLPIVAVDGGMRNRLQKSRSAELARVKTGSLRDVAAVAGYVPDANNRMHAVVVMINHDNAKGAAARPILDAMIDWVANLGATTAIAVAEKN